MHGHDAMPRGAGLRLGVRERGLGGTLTAPVIRQGTHIRSEPVDRDRKARRDAPAIAVCEI